MLSEFCFTCHGNGESEAGVAFDSFPSAQDAVDQRELWIKVLKQLRAGLMPPPGEDRPSSEQRHVIEGWIKSAVFRIDPSNPDPGRITLHRLNRTEYENTVRDLMGVEFDAARVFPADDSGHGFDNNGDVLTISPLLMEKYLQAASAIVSEAVPRETWAPAEYVLGGRRFAAVDAAPRQGRGRRSAGLVLLHSRVRRDDVSGPASRRLRNRSRCDGQRLVRRRHT